VIHRQAAVAGMFYPQNSRELGDMVDYMLNAASQQQILPKAIIAPHAGYIYSGKIAASVYKLTETLRDKIKTVALFGPSHRVAFSGLAVSDASYFDTPLGEVPLDRTKVESVSSLPQVHVLNQAHAQEHSLEVQLPFLQKTLGTFSLVPIVVGDSRADEVAEVMEWLWNEEDTLIVVSSDLSHYHSYTVAQRMDAETSAAIERLDGDDIGDEDACGRNPIKGLLCLAAKHRWQVKTVDLRNSGDTAGSKDRVVGYGAYVFY